MSKVINLLDFSRTDPMKILGLSEEGTDPGISLQFNNILSYQM